MFSARIIRWLAVAAALVLALGVTGCSALRLGYNQGHDLVFWWLDGHADFDAEQAPRVREALRGWFAWHRANELPGYAALLAEAQREVLEPAQAAQACRWVDTLTQRGEAAVRQALPWLADVAVSLTPAQLAHLAQRFEKANADFREEFLQRDADERRQASFKRALDRFENVYGRLDAAQRERLAQLVAASPFDAERWFAERLQRQHDLLSTLRALQALPAEQRTAARARLALEGVVERFTHSPRAAYRDHQRELRAYNCAAFATLHNQTTPAQRQRAAAKLRGWEDDARVLMSNGG